MIYFSVCQYGWFMRDAGCRMIFFGAESGDDEMLASMDKGGRQSGAQILRFAKRLMQAGKQVSASDLADTSIKMQALLKR